MIHDPFLPEPTEIVDQNVTEVSIAALDERQIPHQGVKKGDFCD